MRPVRDRSLRIPLTTPELEALHALAVAEDMSISSLMRRMIKREIAKHAARAPVKEPARGKGKARA